MKLFKQVSANVFRPFNLPCTVHYLPTDSVTRRWTSPREEGDMRGMALIIGIEWSLTKDVRSLKMNNPAPPERRLRISAKCTGFYYAIINQSYLQLRSNGFDFL